MAIRFQCPSCAKTYSTDDNFAGRKLKCKDCGHAFQVPTAAANPAPASAPAGTIPFRCDGCGKTFHAPASFAGKTGKCKGCGHPIQIPAAAAAAVGATAASKPTPKPKPRPVAVEPPPADIYGLDDDAGPSAGKSANPVLDLDGGSSAVEEKLPSRTAAFEPMTAAKKKIAKRAAKIEKSKISFAGAGLGASLGGVIMFTLIGFRIYRTFTRAARLGGMAMQVASAPEEPSDPREAAAEADKDIEEMLKDSKTAEAKDWLDAAKYPNHGVMEMDTNTARAMVAGFYERGAEKVFVLDPTTLGNAVITAEFVVKLPADPTQRQKCFEWESQHSEGAPLTQDFGQKYVMITTD